MHELSLMEGVLDMVRDSAAQNNIAKVNRIRLVIGKLTMVLPDSMQFGFEVLKSLEEMFQDAVLEIEEKDVVVRCSRCDQQNTLQDFVFLCPRCGSAALEVISGRELYLGYYEGDE